MYVFLLHLCTWCRPVVLSMAIMHMWGGGGSSRTGEMTVLSEIIVRYSKQPVHFT